MIKSESELLNFKETDKFLLGGSAASNERCLQTHLNEFVLQIRVSEVAGQTSTELLVMHRSEPGIVARLFFLNLPDTQAAAQAVAEDLTDMQEPKANILFEQPFKVYSVEYEDDLVVRDSVNLQTTGVGCKITDYPDGSARIYMYDSRKRGPLPLEGYVQSAPMGRRVLESVWKEVTGDER